MTTTAEKVQGLAVTTGKKNAAEQIKIFFDTSTYTAWPHMPSVTSNTLMAPEAMTAASTPLYLHAVIEHVA